MVQGSSLPPLKTNKGKYGILLLICLLAIGGFWLCTQRTKAPESKAELPAPVPPTREQFTTEIEIPEEDAGEPDEGEVDVAKRERSRELVECSGVLDAAQIRGVINGPPRKQVQTCYERRLKDNNLLQGQMLVLLTIAPSGSVRKVSVSGSLRDAQVSACVKRVARTWKFPKPEGGCVRTSVPFTMMPKL